jgi:dTDP-4-amino-4,6-dideoxygalactose transaminase
MKLLQDSGIATRPGTHSIPALGWYRSNFGTSADMFPVAAELEARSMAIPLHNHMGEDDFARVVDALGNV